MSLGRIAMMTKGFVRTLALCTVCALLAAHPAALAAKKAKSDPAGKSNAAREETGTPAAGEEAVPKNVLEEMTKYTAPGPRHRELADFSGTWTSRTRVWENPEAKPVEFTGGAEYKMILGGRFLQIESRSQMNGADSHGLGIFGYDGFKEKYSFYYIHDGETQALAGLGDQDSTGAITFSVAMDMPLAGEHAKPIRAVLRRLTANRHVFEMFEKYVDDREWKVLEITYDRGR
jgi:hypothetical protein